MSTLLLRLAGPVQSWGIDSKFEVRRTEMHLQSGGQDCWQKLWEFKEMKTSAV